MNSCFGRVLVTLILLGTALWSPAGLAAAGAPATSGGPSAQVSIRGEFELYTGALPAVWSYDAQQQRVLIDIEIQKEVHSWVLLDWHAAQPTGFIGREDGCFSFALHQPFPSPSELDRLLHKPSQNAAAAPLDQLPDGLTSVRAGEAGQSYLVVKEPDAIVVFKAESVTDAQPMASLAKDTSRCQPFSQLTRTLTETQASQPAALGATAAATSLLQYNLPYTFRGWIYGHLSYKGKYVSQNKSDYDATLEQCKKDGSGQCKPYYETGGWFGRYGYHCGDGWGGPYDKTVSGQDYCCYLHDRQVWGGTGKDAENLCGFAACMTCKHYTSLPDWEQNFRGDFWAQKAIAVFVGTGIAATLCHPQNHLTGFTCD
jgi:hypothetical protein